MSSAVSQKGLTAVPQPSCKLEPLFSKVVIQREKLAATIIIPKEVEERLAHDVGIVLAVGPEVSPYIHVGQRVVFGKHAGGWVDIPGEEDRVFICIDEDIHGIIND